MRRFSLLLSLLTLLLLGGPPQASRAADSEPWACNPTPEDQLGPYYRPNAPQRHQVGSGYLLKGVVRSALDCAPIPWARIEFWLAGPDGSYGDATRAMVYSALSGEYRFESDFPPLYEGRPPHIHIRVSARGFALLITQHYPRPGDASGRFDLVLVPVP